MTLYYLILPFRLIINIFSSFFILFTGPVKRDSETLDCRQFNQLYYMLNRNDINDAPLQTIKRSFLQKSWGITRYSDGNIKVKADSSDLIYATLGALKDYESGVPSHDFEIALNGIIENNLTIKKLEPDLKDEVFGPNLSLKSNQVLAIISALSLISKTGSIDATLQLKELLWKRGYFMQILFPDLSNLDELLVGYFILSKTSEGLMQKCAYIMMVLLGGLAIPYKLDFQVLLAAKRIEEWEKIA